MEPAFIIPLCWRAFVTRAGVIAVDVPVRTNVIIPNGLFIQNGEFYILHHDGTKVKLF